MSRINKSLLKSRLTRHFMHLGHVAWLIVGYGLGAVLIGYCLVMVLASTFLALLFPFSLVAGLFGLI